MHDIPLHEEQTREMTTYWT